MAAWNFFAVDRPPKMVMQGLRGEGFSDEAFAIFLFGFCFWDEANTKERMP